MIRIVQYVHKSIDQLTTHFHLKSENPYIQSAVELIDQLGYSFKEFTVEGFVQWVEQIDQTQFLLIPIELSSGCFGAWVPDEENNRQYIFYEKRLPLIHQIQVILHEMGHYLCGHKTEVLQINGDTLRLLLSGKLVATGLLRSKKTDLQEKEAEAVATVIQSRALRYLEIEEMCVPQVKAHLDHLRNWGFLR